MILLEILGYIISGIGILVVISKAYEFLELIANKDQTIMNELKTIRETLIEILAFMKHSHADFTHKELHDDKINKKNENKA